MAKMTATVAVEAAIHDALRRLIQEISDQHGVQVTSLRVDWSDVSEVSDSPRYRVELIRVSSFSRHV